MGNTQKTKRYAESDAANADGTPRPIPAPGIGRRIGEVADALGTRTSAYIAMDISSAALQRYIKEENAAPFDALARLCITAGARMEWLATGVGPMLLKDAAAIEKESPASQPARIDLDKLRGARRAARRFLADHGLPRDEGTVDELSIAVYDVIAIGGAEADAERMVGGILRALSKQGVHQGIK